MEFDRFLRVSAEQAAGQRKQIIGWLNRYEWTYSVTLTPNSRDQRTSPDKMLGLLREWDARMNRCLFGPKWTKRFAHPWRGEGRTWATPDAHPCMRFVAWKAESPLCANSLVLLPALTGRHAQMPPWLGSGYRSNNDLYLDCAIKRPGGVFRVAVVEAELRNEAGDSIQGSDRRLPNVQLPAKLFFASPCVVGV